MGWRGARRPAARSGHCRPRCPTTPMSAALALAMRPTDPSTWGTHCSSGGARPATGRWAQSRLRHRARRPRRRHLSQRRRSRQQPRREQRARPVGRAHHQRAADLRRGLTQRVRGLKAFFRIAAPDVRWFLDLIGVETGRLGLQARHSGARRGQSRTRHRDLYECALFHGHRADLVDRSPAYRDPRSRPARGIGGTDPVARRRHRVLRGPARRSPQVRTPPRPSNGAGQLALGQGAERRVGADARHL